MKLNPNVEQRSIQDLLTDELVRRTQAAKDKIAFLAMPTFGTSAHVLAPGVAVGMYRMPYGNGGPTPAPETQRLEDWFTWNDQRELEGYLPLTYKEIASRVSVSEQTVKNFGAKWRKTHPIR